MRGLIIAFFCLTPLAVLAEASQRYAATLTQVVDAVTYVLDVHMDGGIQRIRLSLDGVEGPKLYGSRCEREAALFAKDLARSILRPQENLIISDLHREDSQFVGHVEFYGRNLGHVLLNFKQVRPRGKSGNWCNSLVG